MRSGQTRFELDVDCDCFLAYVSVHGYYYYYTQSEFCLDPKALDMVKTVMVSQVFYCFSGGESMTVQ